MGTNKKGTIIILALFISLPVAELVREEVIYLLTSHRLKAACEQIEKGMTKAAVKSLAGEPEATTTQEDQETWFWDAGTYQGAWWKRLGLTWMKGHYSLVTAFDKDGGVIQKWGGIN